MINFISNKLYISFKCHKNKNEKKENVKVCYLKKDNLLLVDVFKDNKFKLHINFPYIENNIFKIEYDFEAIYSLDFNYKGDDRKVEEYKGLRIIKEMNPDLAKKEFKLLKEKKLISNTYWDDFINYYDINCLACHHSTSSTYECYSNPMLGRVREISRDIRFKNIKAESFNHCEKDQFIYNGVLYGKIPSDDWYKFTFWNEEEYQEIKKVHNIPDFNEVWIEFQTYRDNSGKITKKPNGEKVVTLGLKTTPVENSVDCPICERLFKICDAFDWIPKFPRSLICKYLKK